MGTQTGGDGEPAGREVDVAGRQLHPDELELLREAVFRYRPELLSLLDALGKTPLTSEEREGLRGAVSEEFGTTGLQPDSNPNKRGLLLEDLIDRLGHL